MKKAFGILLPIVFLLSVGFAYAALYINEPNITEEKDPDFLPFTKTITLNNTGNIEVNVTSFSGLDIRCPQNTNEVITATVVQNLPIIVSNNSLARVNISFVADRTNKFACTYQSTIYASGSSDPLPVKITVKENPKIDVTNITKTIQNNVTETSYLEVAIKNTGNTNLNNLIYSYPDFKYGTSLLTSGSSGILNIPYGETRYLTIPISTTENSNLPDGPYSSKLRITGNGINREVTLTVNLKTLKASVSIPDSIVVNATNNKNKTVTSTLKIKNTGDYSLEGVDIFLGDIDSKYNATLSTIPDTIAPGQEVSATLTIFIPTSEESGKHQIGNIYFYSDKIPEKIIPLSVEIKNLFIGAVYVSIDNNKKTVENNGGKIDYSNTNPGSKFKVDVKICNAYDNKDYSISNIAGTVTFEGIDDGDDLEGEISEFDLDGKECKTVAATFDKDRISYLADEGYYDLKIEISGEDDEYEIEHSDEWTISIRVYRKESTDIKLDEVSLNPSTVECGFPTTLKVVAYNIGERDNDAKLTITSPALGIDITKYFKIGESIDDNCDAVDEPDEKCIGIDHTFTLAIPAVPAAIYPINVAVFKGDNKETDKRTVNLSVNCGGMVAPTPTQITPSSNASSTTTSTGTTNQTTTGTITTQPTATSGVVIRPSGTTTSTSAGTPVRIKDISSKNNLWIAGLIAGNVLLIAIIIIVLMAIFRSRA